MLWQAAPEIAPRRWYDHLTSTQIFWGAATLGLPEPEQPVVMRGSLHCRVCRHNSPRWYLHALAVRLLRRRRVTFVDRDLWVDYVRRDLLPLFQQHPLWFRQRSLLSDLYDMVGSNHVVLDGVPRWVSSGQARLIRRLARTAKKVR